MSAATGLDIRVPIGWLFTAIGVVIAGWGLITGGDAERYARSGGLNVNLWWGLFMLAFGVVCLVLARRATRVGGPSPTAASPQGRATEAREHREGLEREP
jgi:hypothetical protein